MDIRRLKKVFTRLKNLPTGKYLFLYFFNKIRHLYYKITKSVKVAYPSTIMIELTNHCNLACTTCAREYGYGKQMDKGNININDAKIIIDEVWPYLDSIGLTGMGETFLYSQIKQVVEYIKSKNKGIIISMSTNAVLPNFIEKVESLIGYIDTIQVSIDGLDDVYELIRVKSDFELLDKNLRTLVQLAKTSKTDIMLNMVVTKENYGHMSALVSYAKKLGIKYVNFSVFNLAAVTDIEKTYYKFYNTPEFIEATTLLNATIKSTPEVFVTGSNLKPDNSFKKCPFMFSHFYICWNGFVVPCCAKPFPKILNFGNVFENKVIDVLNSNEFKKFRKLWYKNLAPGFCDKCNFIAGD